MKHVYSWISLLATSLVFCKVEPTYPDHNSTDWRRFLLAIDIAFQHHRYSSWLTIVVLMHICCHELLGVQSPSIGESRVAVLWSSDSPDIFRDMNEWNGCMFSWASCTCLLSLPGHWCDALSPAWSLVRCLDGHANDPAKRTSCAINFRPRKSTAKSKFNYKRVWFKYRNTSSFSSLLFLSHTFTTKLLPCCCHIHVYLEPTLHVSVLAHLRSLSLYIWSTVLR